MYQVPRMTRAYLAYKRKKPKGREVRCILHAYRPSFLPFPEHVLRHFFHQLTLSLNRTPTTTTKCSDDTHLLTILSTPQLLHPFPEHVCRRQPARMRSSLYIYIYVLLLYIVDNAGTHCIDFGREGITINDLSFFIY